jgi:uncharacterized protein (DUF952 family)
MIFHIVKRSEWEIAAGRGNYAAESLRAEGFIHCSTHLQVIDTANRFYRGESGLVVLCIEESRLKSELRFEAPLSQHGESMGEMFPHLYGELNVDAVIRVVELPSAADGSFLMPGGLRAEKES